jgi:cyclophilin family peptidyl-prolyl cis-trans isomerase
MKRTILLCALLALPLAGLRAQSTVPTVASPIAAQSLTVGAPAAEFDLSTIFSVPGVTGQIVQFDTVLGKFNVETLADAAPNHVANFLAYVNAGDYSNTFFHRVNGLGTNSHAILQGGGYYATLPSLPAVPKRATVNLEYNLPNARGTLAAARTSVLNSATSEWYFNTQDNTTTLGPTNNSGFSVFARVLGTGMTIVDTIAAKQLYNLGGVFAETPLRDVAANQTVALVSNFLTVNATTVVPLFPTSSNQTAAVSFTVSSNQTNVATATLVAGRTLSINPVGAGNATLTLTATDTNGNSAQTTVPVVVAATTVAPRRDILTIGTPASLPLAVVRGQLNPDPHPRPQAL